MVATKTVTLLGVLGMLHWFFGNLYECVVIAPNWIVHSAAQLERLHDFFVRTSPTAYFVPISLLAPALLWAAHWLNRASAATPDFRRASAWALAAAAINAFIVITIVSRLFGADYRSHSEAELHALCVRWNVLNSLRMAFTAAAAFWAFSAFRKLDRSAPSRLAPAGQCGGRPARTPGMQHDERQQ